MVSLDVPIDRFNQALAPFRNDRRFRASLHKGALWIGDSDWLSIGTPPPTPVGLDAHRITLEGTAGGQALSPLGPGLRGVHESIAEGWGLMLLMDEDAVLAPLRETTWRFVGATLVVIALLALLSNALARSVTRPMVQLGNAAQQLAQEGFAMPTPLLVRKDEVGQLARVLDSADSALRQQMAHS